MGIMFCLTALCSFAAEEEFPVIDDKFIEDYLNKDCLVPPLYDFEPNFGEYITQFFAKQTTGTIILSGICLPSFSKEYGIFVTEDKGKYSLEIIEPKKQIWTAREGENKETIDASFLIKK